MEEVDANFSNFYQQLHQDEDDQYFYYPEHGNVCANTLQRAFKVKPTPRRPLTMRYDRELFSSSQGPIHTGRAHEMQANGTC